MEYTATITLKRCVDVHLLDWSVSLPTYERSVPLHLIVLYSTSMTSRLYEILIISCLFCNFLYPVHYRVLLRIDDTCWFCECRHKDHLNEMMR